MSMPEGREVLVRLMCHIDFGKPVCIPCGLSEPFSCYRTACTAVNEGPGIRAARAKTADECHESFDASILRAHQCAVARVTKWLHDDGLWGQIVICTVLTTSAMAVSQMALLPLLLLSAKTVPSNPNEEGRDGRPYHQDS